MEADTGLAVPLFLNDQHTAISGFFPYGCVMYEHGGGIDAPLGVVRMEFSDELKAPCQFPVCNVQDNVPPTGDVAPGASQAATSKPIHGATKPQPLNP
jgi:hypothetical protein